MATYRPGRRGRRWIHPLPSRPAPLFRGGVQAEETPARVGLGQVGPAAIPATAGDVKAQGVRMADVFVFGPMMIWSAIGRGQMPTWLKAGMLIVGAGTIIYNLANYFEIERRKRDAGIIDDPDVSLSGMSHGPMHRASADLHRPMTLVQRVERQ